MGRRRGHRVWQHRGPLERGRSRRHTGGCHEDGFGKEGRRLRWPVALPDGKTVLFVQWTGTATTSSIAVASIGGNDRRTLVEGAIYPRLTANNILVFTRVRSLDVATDGTLVYIRAGLSGGSQRLVWLDRNGQAESAVSEKLGGCLLYTSPSPRD